MGFLFNLSNRASPKKTRLARSDTVRPSGPIGPGQIWPSFFRANKIRVQPDPNFGLVGQAQRAGLKLPTLIMRHEMRHILVVLLFPLDLELLPLCYCIKSPHNPIVIHMKLGKMPQNSRAPLTTVNLRKLVCLIS